MLEQKIRPMEPVSRKEPFDSPDYLFQVKWDGVRMLAFVSAGAVRLQNRNLNDRTRQYPELQQLARSVKASTAILDGEVVAFYQGKPSFPRVIKRDLSSRDSHIRGLVEEVPVHYILFDILYLDGTRVTPLPLTDRYSLLSTIVLPTPQIMVTDNYDTGRALFTAVAEQGLEGIVAKHRNSPYLPGKKDARWLKVKVRNRRLCVVGGYTTRGSVANALLLGAYDRDQLHYVGKASSGLSHQEWRTITGYLAGNEQPHPPFVNPPRGRPGTFHWVRPALTVRVEFSEWTGEMHLRAPVITGFGTAAPEECVLY